jgi:hypothetical protein
MRNPNQPVERFWRSALEAGQGLRPFFSVREAALASARQR